jgi:hypothetical protein
MYFDPDRLPLILLKNKLKLCSASSNEGADTVLFNILRTTPLTATPNLCTNDALLQRIRWSRLAMQLGDQDGLPLLLQQTVHSGSIVLYEDD